MAAAAFPLPLACVPPTFAPAWHELTDALPEGTSTFYLPLPPPAAGGLLASLQTPVAQRAVAVVDLVQDVVGSGRLAPAALQRLRDAAAGGAPWWLVVRNLEGCDSPARVVNGGNLLMVLLERRAGARYEGLELSRSAALLVAAGGGELRALQGRWRALAALAPPARGQTPLNTDALFARVAKADLPASASGREEWSAALHSAACRGARGRGGGGGAGGRGAAVGGGTGSGSSAAWQWAAAGAALLAAVALALWALRRLQGRQAAAAGGARGGSSGSGGSSSGGSSSGGSSGAQRRAPAPAAQPHGPARQRSGSASAGPSGAKAR